MLIDSPADLPEEGDTLEIREPWMKIQIFTPTEFYGVVMDTDHQTARHLHRPGVPRSKPGAASF